MMKKIVMSVYAACAMLVIAGSLLWFVFTLHSDAAAGKTAALNNFKVFAQHTGEVVSASVQEAEPVRLQPRFEQLCRNYQKYVQAVVIKDSTGIIFTWPKDTDIFSYAEQYAVEVKNLPLFFTAAQTHIPVKETGNTVTIHAALRTLPVETIFNRGKIVFFLLLLIVLMTVIVLVFAYMDLKPAAKKPVVNGKEYMPKADISSLNIIQSETAQSDEHLTEQTATHDDGTVHPVTTSPEVDTPDTTPDTDQTACENPPVSYNESVSEKHTAQADASNVSLPLHEQLESLNRLHIYDDEPSHQVQSAPQESIPDADMLKEPNTPKAEETHGLKAENYGAFENHTQTAKSPTEIQPTAKSGSVTSFENTPLADTAHSDSHSLEQATLIEELTTAITETAVAEEDLTLMLIHATDISHNQQIIHLLRATLDRIHKIFIFNQDTLGLIVFYAPLDQAMQIASTLYDEIHTLLENSVKTSLGIGLTTRAGRLIPAPRMIEEAAAAIGKATEEGSDPIVAFRVNPDKYRRCLARLS